MNNKNNKGIIEYLIHMLDKFQGVDGNTKLFWEKYKQLGLDFNNKQEINLAYFLKEFTDEMPGGFFIYHADKTEKIIYANKAMAKIFDCDTIKEFYELTGGSFRGIVHHDDLDKVQQSIKEQILNSKYKLDHVEYRITTKSGDIRWIDDYGHFVHSDILGDIFYVFLADITERKVNQIKEKMNLLEEKNILLNEKLEKEQILQNQINEYNHKLDLINSEYLRQLETIEGLSFDYESIFYVNLDTNLIKAYRLSERFEKTFPENNRIREFTGFDTNYIDEWVLPEDREIVLGVTTPEYIREKLSMDKTFHINYRVKKNNKPMYIQLRVVNVSNNKHISQVIMGYRNIDEEIIQEMKQKQILKKALNEANLANNAKNLFLSNMSHDIRTPMNAIIGFTSLAKKHIDDKNRLLNYLDMISKSSDQLLQLLNDILEISRIKSGEINTEETECNLLDIIQKIQSNVLSQASSKNIMLFLDISNLMHNTVYIDHQKLSQALSYIVDNAVKYTKENGRIIIMVKEQADLGSDYSVYKFIVEDNGIGINKKFIKNIFEPFEREKNTTLSGVHGTGLGLSIARDLVEIMGGTIEVSSIEGKGSKFTITLTVRIKNCMPERLDNANSNNVLINFSTPKRILIVDDNIINLEIENEVLKDCGFLVDTASDGSVAVEKVKRSQPGYYDLILMDIQMPIMNGYDATRAIRKIKNSKLSNIPIIAVSANTSEEDKKASLESGMNAHLPKPFDATHLYKMILEFLQ